MHTPDISFCRLNISNISLFSSLFDFEKKKYHYNQGICVISYGCGRTAKKLEATTIQFVFEIFSYLVW